MATKDISDRQVCEAVQAYADDSSRWPYDVLAEVTGQSQKVCWRALERAASRGLVEYGVSLRTGWLTEKGRQFIPESGRKAT
jgi:hypothetical protein